MNRRNFLACSGVTTATFVSGCIADDTPDVGDALPIGGDDCSEEWDCIGDEFLDWDEDDYPPVRTECAPEFYDEEDADDRSVIYRDHPLENEEILARVEEYNDSRDPRDKLVNVDQILDWHEDRETNLRIHVLGERYTDDGTRTRHGFRPTSCEFETIEKVGEGVRKSIYAYSLVFAHQAKSEEKLMQAASLPFVLTIELDAGGDDN